MDDKNVLNDEELNKVAGGSDEPEEFDWKSKGYVTPIKEQHNNGWKFEAYGNTDGQYFKKTIGDNKINNDIDD